MPSRDTTISLLGPAAFPSPLQTRAFAKDGQRVLIESDPELVASQLAHGQTPATYELAGPRPQLFYNPAKVTAAIVTCGGLCPGINDVVRAIFMQLRRSYGVPRILGLKYGYQGLNPAYGHQPLLLEEDKVDDIHQHGGSILSSSRGEQDPRIMVDFLVDRGIDMLFAIGGDGTLKGALAIQEEIQRRNVPIAVIGIPKSIDNDVACIDKTFGFETAVAASRTAIECAHNEAKGAPNGVGIVKLMGRHSGFIAAWATLAFSEVNLTLVPEVPFQLHGHGQVLEYLMARLRARHHAVVVVAEGAGQELFRDELGTDKSGNAKLHDVGERLCREIAAEGKRQALEVNVKYIDPSYTIRSVPASADDSVYCLHLGQCAADAAMSGRTGMIVGTWNNNFVHIPLALATAGRRVLDPNAWVWQSVLHSTGQPDWGSF